MSPAGYPWVSTKKISSFGPAVWPARGNIYMNVLFYYKILFQGCKLIKYYFRVINLKNIIARIKITKYYFRFINFKIILKFLNRIISHKLLIWLRKLSFTFPDLSEVSTLTQGLVWLNVRVGWIFKFMNSTLSSMAVWSWNMI